MSSTSVLWWRVVRSRRTGDRVAMSGAAAASLAGLPDPATRPQVRRPCAGSAPEGGNVAAERGGTTIIMPVTNPIESTFASVRLRTDRTKGCRSRETALAMVFRLCQSAPRRWRRLNGPGWFAEVVRGVRFVDGQRQVQDAA